jgi:hypothetical protein
MAFVWKTIGQQAWAATHLNERQLADRHLADRQMGSRNISSQTYFLTIFGQEYVQHSQFDQHIIEQAASDKSSLILKIILQNTQTLQIFTKIIKTESIHRSYKNPKLAGLSSDAK